MYRVAIGDAPEAAGKGPKRLDYFKVKRRSPETRAVWVTDESAQKKLAEGFTDPFGRDVPGFGVKPQRVPIVLFSDKLADMLVSGLAWYGRRGRYCWATEFQGVEFEDEAAPAHCKLARYGKPPGMDDTTFAKLSAFHSGRDHACRPAACPNYAPEKGGKLVGYACNRFLFFRFLLPFAPTFPGVAEFRTKGFASCIALENTIRGFHSELQGHPAGVILHLAMQPIQVQYDGGTTTAWEVRLEAPEDMTSFRRTAAKALEARIEGAAQLAHIAEEFKALPAWTEETGEQIHEYTREFLPSQEELPETDPGESFEAYAVALGWLPGQKAAVLAKFQGDLSAAADYAEEELRRHSEEPAPTVPPEPEAEPERDEQGLTPEDYEPPTEPQAEEPKTAADGGRDVVCEDCGGPISEKMRESCISGGVAKALGLADDMEIMICSGCGRARAAQAQEVA